MALRIQTRGYVIANAPSASVHTTTPRTLQRLFRQRVRWTYGFLRNAADYRSLFGNREYGNLGILVLPTAFISILAALYFFTRVVWYGTQSIYTEITRVALSGIWPHPGFELFYVNTSALWFLVCIAIALVLALISMGSFIGTGKRLPPAGTPLFLILYGFLVPLWLGTAVVRAAFKTGTRWR